MKTKKFEKQQQKTKLIFNVISSFTNFEIKKYYQNSTKFNDVYSRDNLPKIKDGEYVINLDVHSDVGTHRIALYVQKNDVIYFDSFEVGHILREIKTFISNKNIKINIFRIQGYDSVMCGYICIGFKDFMLAGKTLTDFTNLFLPNNFKKKNDDIILNYFKINVQKWLIFMKHIISIQI